MRKTLFGLALGLSLAVFAAAVNVNDTTVYQALFRPWTRTTTQLPTASAYLGYVAYDTTLSRLTVSDGTAWRPLAQTTGGETVASLAVGPGAITGDGGMTLVGGNSPLAVGQRGISTDGGLIVTAGTSALQATTTTTLTGTTITATTGVAIGSSNSGGTAGNPIIYSHSGTRTWNFSLGDNSISTSGNLTVTGAVVTDQCIASSNMGIDGGAILPPTEIRLGCVVTAADTVQFQMSRPSTDGGTYSPGDAGYYARIFR